MKLILAVIFLASTLLSDTIKVCLYSPEVNVNNFKSLKAGFDAYLSGYGNYELQPFSDKDTFEKYLKKKNTVVILSSWHYREIARKYNLEAMLVAQKKGSITDKKILVGPKNAPFRGVVTSAYDKEYTTTLLEEMGGESIRGLSPLRVPKEIDALMSVGFGMSRFALVSRESFHHLQQINPVLSRELKIHYESEPEYRMVLACNETTPEEKRLISIFKNMENSDAGKNILKLIGIDRMVTFGLRNPDTTGDAP